MVTVTSLSFPVTESSFHAVINASVIRERWGPRTLCNVYDDRCIRSRVEHAHFVHGSRQLMEIVIGGPMDFSSCCKRSRKNQRCWLWVLAPRIELGTLAFEMTWTAQGLGRISETLRLKEWWWQWVKETGFLKWRSEPYFLCSLQEVKDLS